MSDARISQPPRAAPGVRQPFLLVVPALFALGTLVTLFCFNPSHYAFYPGCLFYKITGLLCPGCGSLRAIHHLLHGELGVAFAYNPLLMVSLPLVAWLSARWCLAKLHGRTAPATCKPGWFLACLVIALVFAVLRNLPGAPLPALPQ